MFGDTTATKDVTVSIFTSATGESGSKVSINKAMLLSALTIVSNTLGSVAHTSATNAGAANTAGNFTFAVSTSAGAMTLDKVSVAVFSQALQNIATLRAENGGSVSRLQFSKESTAAQKTNLEAANGRIMDVDIAQESTALAKYNILVQASASMLSQANSTPNVALMLLN
jgi:flagellin